MWVDNLSPEKLNQTVRDYIQNYKESQDEDFELCNLASDIALRINDSCLLEGRNPKTITALSLIMASKLIKPKNTTRKIVCEHFCSENTLDNAYEKIKPHLDRIIPEKYSSEIKNFSLK